MTLIAMVVPSSQKGADPLNLTKFILIPPPRLPLFEHLGYLWEVIYVILWGMLLDEKPHELLIFMSLAIT
jgi:hypothetical protein